MGGPDGSFNGRYRALDGLRQWHDPHDLIVLVGVVLASVIATLAFVSAVFASSIWMRAESLEQRLDRIESAVFIRAHAQPETDDNVEVIGGW